VIQLDVLPTALAAAGVEGKPEWQLDGVNLLPYLAGRKEAAPHDTLYRRLGEQMATRWISCSSWRPSCRIDLLNSLVASID
jgi:arylsulfatase A-like enzyme